MKPRSSKDGGLEAAVLADPRVAELVAARGTNGLTRLDLLECVSQVIPDSDIPGWRRRMIVSLEYRPVFSPNPNAQVLHP